MAVDRAYVDAVRAATRAAGGAVLPDRGDWVRQLRAEVAAGGGRAPDSRIEDTLWRDHVARVRAMKFLDVFGPGTGWKFATLWVYSHEPGPARFQGDLRGEASIDTDTGPCLGDGVIVQCETFFRREGDFMRVLGRLAGTGAMLVLAPLEGSGLLSREREAWLREERGYVRAMDGGCLFRPAAEGLDY